jgi:hypothetical protein
MEVLATTGPDSAAIAWRDVRADPAVPSERAVPAADADVAITSVAPATAIMTAILAGLRRALRAPDIPLPPCEWPPSLRGNSWRAWGRKPARSGRLGRF